MDSQKIGYARCSTNGQDLTAQRHALLELGVHQNRIYTDHGLTGANRERPGLQLALAAVRQGDTLVVTKLDRLARSVPDIRAAWRDRIGRPANAKNSWVGSSPQGRPRDFSLPMTRSTHSFDLAATA